MQMFFFKICYPSNTFLQKYLRIKCTLVLVWNQTFKCTIVIIPGLGFLSRTATCANIGQGELWEWKCPSPSFPRLPSMPQFGSTSDAGNFELDMKSRLHFSKICLLILILPEFVRHFFLLYYMRSCNVATKFSNFR